MLNLQVVQEGLSSVIASQLSDMLHTEIRVGKTTIGPINRIILSDVLIMDQQQDTLLNAARLAAKIDIIESIRGKITIRNAQLFGCYVNIYQNNPKGKTNLQFLIDAFASKDSTSTSPLNLRFNSVLVRRGEFKFNKRFEPETPGKLNTNHLHIKNLSTNISLKTLSADSLNFQIKHLSFKEQSGLEIDKIKLKVLANRNKGSITDLSIRLPQSNLRIDSVSVTYPDSPQFIGWKQWLHSLHAQITIKNTRLTPNDLRCLEPELEGLHETVCMNLEGEINNGNLSNNDIHIFTENQDFDLQISAAANNLYNEKKRESDIHIEHFRLNSEILDILTNSQKKKIEKYIEYLKHAKFLHASGYVKTLAKSVTAHFETGTAAGKLSIYGTFTEDKTFYGRIHTNELKANKILKDKGNLGKIAFFLNFNGNIKHKTPVIRATGDISKLEFNGYTYQNIHLDGMHNHNGFSGSISMNDPNGDVSVSGKVNPYSNNPGIDIQATINNLSPCQLNLWNKKSKTKLSGEILADFTGLNMDQIQGELALNNLIIEDEKGKHNQGNILINWKKGWKNHKEINLQSDFMQVSLSGDFKFNTLVKQMQASAANYLPGFIDVKKQKVKANEEDATLQASVHIQKLDILNLLTDTPVRFWQAANIQATYDSKKDLVIFHAKAPHIQYENENLKGINISYFGSNGFLNGSLAVAREMNRQLVHFNILTDIQKGVLKNKFSWFIPNNKKHSGNIELDTYFESLDNGERQTIIEINPSRMLINDSIWDIHKSRVCIHPEEVSINNFRIDHSDCRFLKVNGRISENKEDTLAVNLKNINLQYVFNMINFHAVEFDGSATGKVYAQNLMKNATINAFLNVKDFTFNSAPMGFLKANAYWNANDKSIILDAFMNDSTHNSTTIVQGSITPGNNPGSGLDLNIKAENTNLFFLNEYTEGIFTDLQGRTSGSLRVYGPFQEIDLNGDMLVKHANLKVDVLNTRFHMFDNMIKIRPGKIIFENSKIFDDNGGPGINGHNAIINGMLQHDHFSDLSYHIDIKTNNILAYNQKEFGDNLFCGTAYASGNVNISGYPGALNVDINAWPDAHTVFTYNLSRPDVLTENHFIRFVSSKKKDTSAEKLDLYKNPDGLLPDDDLEESDARDYPENTEAQNENSTDVRVNFNLHITPRATIKILMDARSGDYISANGNGNIKASFYNKGKFQMYGTYTVNEGIYKLSLQNVIRKDFIFSPGGHVVFGGDPNMATLNLQAIYSVPSVSLNDLSSGKTFSQNNVRVNCLMNIQGQARQPNISFDFDIPNVNEDEKKMVKSLISTEEEKNMQIVYLLGIGRFYTYDYNNPDQSQSSVAMKSLLSSTLTGQLNEMLSNIIGSNNWNFGTNLSTGERGWSDMDVEGLLSGRLLDNRLLINGKFGYQENSNTYKASNFIGDFDIQWLLTPNGNIALKGYSETNDRYFTKSTLTTQGIGLQLKKDFSSWRDLFNLKPKKTNSLHKSDTLLQK